MSKISKIAVPGVTEPYDIEAYKALSIPFGQVDSTSTDTAYTAQIEGITSLYDGVCVYLKNGVITSNENGFTLNVNGLGAKPVYGTMAAATKSGAVFNVNYTMLFVYNSSRVTGGCWDIFYGYNSDTNTLAYNVRVGATPPTTSNKLVKYGIAFTKTDGKLLSCNTTGTTATSKAVTAIEFDPFAPIYYYPTTAVAANGTPSATYLYQQYSTVDLRYAFNAGSTLVVGSPVYVRCVPQSDGTAKLDGNNCIVQTLPTQEDGKIYIYLGYAYSTTSIFFDLKHPIYYINDNKREFWWGNNEHIHTHVWSDITNPPATYTPSSHSHTWSNIIDPPLTYPPSSHTHNYTEINGLGALATVNTISWSSVTNTPTTYTPSTHTHDYAATTHTHTWNQISNPPVSYTPSTHTHDYAASSHSHAWSQITNTPATYTPSSHSHGEYAPIASPSFTGTPTAPTPAANNDSAQIANTGWVWDRIDGLGTVFNLKGTKSTISELPSSGNSIGDVWYVAETSVGYIWLEDETNIERWEKFGEPIDLTGYATMDDIQDIRNDMPAVPTQLSAFQNDMNFISSSDNISELNNDIGYITSNDLPTNISYFNNDVGYITSAEWSDSAEFITFTTSSMTNGATATSTITYIAAVNSFNNSVDTFLVVNCNSQNYNFLPVYISNTNILAFSVDPVTPSIRYYLNIPVTAGAMSGTLSVATLASTSDIPTLPATYTPSAHTHTWANLSNPPSSYTPSAHSHSWSEITNTPATYTPSTHTHSDLAPINSPQFTGNPTAPSPNEEDNSTAIANTSWVNSAISSAIDALPDLPATYTPSAHTHTWANISNPPASYTPSSHSHSWSEITNQPTIPVYTAGDGITISGSNTISSQCWIKNEDDQTQAINDVNMAGGSIIEVTDLDFADHAGALGITVTSALPTPSSSTIGTPGRLKFLDADNHYYYDFNSAWHKLAYTDDLITKITLTATTENDTTTWTMSPDYDTIDWTAISNGEKLLIASYSNNLYVWTGGTHRERINTLSNRIYLDLIRISNPSSSGIVITSAGLIPSSILSVSKHDADWDSHSTTTYCDLRTMNLLIEGWHDQYTVQDTTLIIGDVPVEENNISPTPDPDGEK